MTIARLQADACAKLEANLNDGQPLDEGAVFIAGSELLKELPEIILSTVLAVREEVVPKEREIPLQQYDYDEIPDEKLTEINVNRQLLGENLARLEILRRFDSLLDAKSV